MGRPLCNTCGGVVEDTTEVDEEHFCALCGDPIIWIDDLPEFEPSGNYER